MRRRTTGRRTAAVLAVAAAAFTLTTAVVVAVDDFPRGLLILVFGLLTAVGSWEGVLRRGWARVAALALAALSLGSAPSCWPTRGSCGPCSSSVSAPSSGTSAPGSRSSRGSCIPPPSARSARCCS